MKKNFILLTIFFFFALTLKGQTDLPPANRSLTMAFWNVDNLYDIYNDPKTNDEDFLPAGIRQWNEEKYRKKISDIAVVLSSLNEKELPAVIGLAGVENQKVLEDLVSSPRLKKGKYGIIHFDSKDERGLDVAMLYNKDEIQIESSKTVPVTFGFDIKDSTTDILYVKCRIKDDNLYHIFINYWPSRTPSEQESEIKRISAAISLRKEVDNILNVDNKARIIIMGDFNDEPTNKSLIQTLYALNKRKNMYYRDLFNLMYDTHNSGNEGTVLNKDTWQMFDQIIVSQEVFNNDSGLCLSFNDGRIYKGDEVLFTDPITKLESPRRTYDGNSYLGGVSDHLPVWSILKKSK